MHDFRTHFQNCAFVWIYRGLGKSEIHTVFWTIPYSWEAKIGAMDGVSGPDFEVPEVKMSLFDHFPENPGKIGKNRTFLAFLSKTLKKQGGKWPKVAILATFRSHTLVSRPRVLFSGEACISKQNGWTENGTSNCAPEGVKMGCKKGSKTVIFMTFWSKSRGKHGHFGPFWLKLSKND